MHAEDHQPHHHQLAVELPIGKEIIGAMMKTIMKDVIGMVETVVVLMLEINIALNVNVWILHGVHAKCKYIESLY